MHMVGHHHLHAQFDAVEMMGEASQWSSSWLFADPRSEILAWQTQRPRIPPNLSDNGRLTANSYQLKAISFPPNLRFPYD